MKRTSISACALLILLTAAASHAEESVFGFVEAAAVHPGIPRTLYTVSPKLNGVSGYVVEIEPSDSERRFDLQRIAGITGREDLDAWFYRDITGTGDPCPRLVETQTETGEQGTVCAGATFAVVVLFAGGDAEFELTIS